MLIFLGVGVRGQGQGPSEQGTGLFFQLLRAGHGAGPGEEAQGGVLNMQGVGAECVLCSYLWTKGRPLKGAGYSQSQGLVCGEGP